MGGGGPGCERQKQKQKTKEKGWHAVATAALRARLKAMKDKEVMPHFRISRAFHCQVFVHFFPKLVPLPCSKPSVVFPFLVSVSLSNFSRFFPTDFFADFFANFFANADFFADFFPNF